MSPCSGDAVVEMPESARRLLIQSKRELEDAYRVLKGIELPLRIDQRLARAVPAWACHWALFARSQGSPETVPEGEQPNSAIKLSDARTGLGGLPELPWYRKLPTSLASAATRVELPSCPQRVCIGVLSRSAKRRIASAQTRGVNL